ncbi:MAG: hypothetical protein Q9222_006274 [Ikaeria aurantiellina]
MGWLWSSTKACPPSSKSSGLEEEGPTESVPSLQTPKPALDPPVHDNSPDAEIQSLLSSLESPPPSISNSALQLSSSTGYEQDPKAIPPHSLHPTELSCRAAFDSAFYCQSLGGQFNNIYRYGTFRDCRDQWSNFWFCMRTNRGFLGDEERQSRIREHYKLREMKYKVGPSSEDVWKPRTRMVEGAFERSLEADERAEAEAARRTDE